MTEKIIILKIIRYGDADLVVHGLTPDGAKTAFFARSALKSKKRFGGGILEPTHFVKIRSTPARGGKGMSRLEEASLLESFAGLRKEYERLELGLYFVSVIAKTSLEGMIDSSEMFHLLGNALRAAETSGNLSALKLHFELRYLACQGVLPPLDGIEGFLSLTLKEHELVAPKELDQQALREAIGCALRGYLG